MNPVSTETPPIEADLPLNAAVNAPPQNDAALSEAWVTLRKRKWVILFAALAGLLYGFYQGSTQPHVYIAAGTIEIRSGSSNEYRINGIASGMEANTHIPTQVAILKSDTLLLAVARDLDLANNHTFSGSQPGHYRNLDTLAVRQSVLGGMQGAVSVAPVPKTDLIRISCSTADPQLSADIVNKLVREYILHSFQSRADASQRVNEFFSHQLDDLKQQVQTAQEQMIDLQKRIGVLGFDPSQNQITSTLSDLSKAAGIAQLASIQAQTRYDVLTHSDPGLLNDPTGTSGSGPVTAVRTQLYSARANLAELSANLGPNHPQVKALRDQIAKLNQEVEEEEGRTLGTAKQLLNAARVQQNQTNAALDAEKANAYKLRDDLLEYTRRQREFEANRTLYEGLLQRLRTAGVEAGLESTEIDPIDLAVPPMAPSLRPRSSFLAVDTMVMVLFGIILAFVLDSLDTGIRSVAEIEAISGLPSLALIPRTRRTAADPTNLTPVMRNVATLASPKSQFSEAFRALRTSLLLSTAGREPQTILLTSATPSEGKTTVSINLACVLAQRDVRVLLIDADLRRPTVHHRFGLNGKVGLTSVLTGSVSLEDAIQHVPELRTLDVLVSGPVPPFPTEMLASDVMRDLLQKCRGIYTHIVMDSPPLLSVTDSVVLSRDADAVVLIVRHGKSSKHAVRRARDLLVRSGAPVTGVALNAVDLNSPEYYAYYGYYGYSSYASAGVDTAAWESKNGDPDNSRGSREGGQS